MSEYSLDEKENQLRYANEKLDKLIELLEELLELNKEINYNINEIRRMQPKS